MVALFHRLLAKPLSWQKVSCFFTQMTLSDTVLNFEKATQGQVLVNNPIG